MTKVLGSETWPSPFPLNNEQRLLLNPARIRCARETAGLSKVQLAQLLSVDPRTITNYEKDGAPQTKINALSEILKVMPSFFTVHPSDPAIGDLSETQVWFLLDALNNCKTAQVCSGAWEECPVAVSLD